MARNLLAITAIDETGVTAPAETNGDAANGHYIASVPPGRSWIEVRNADGSNPHTVSVVVTAKPGGNTVTPKAYTIAASATKRIKFGDPAVYGRKVSIDVDSSQLKLLAWTVGL